MVTYRHYQAGDEVKIVDLWNESLWKDPITPKRFRNLVLLDANFDPEGLRVAFDGENLVGVVYAVRRLLPMFGTDLEPDNGWIPFFFVDEGYRKTGVGKRLMNDATNFLKEHGRKHVFFASYAPNYIMPGVDEEAYPEAYQFLLSQGFDKLYSPIAMDRNIVDFKLSDEIKDLVKLREEEGYTFSLAEDKDLYDVIQFANIKFNPDWGRAIREGVLQGLPMERILVARQGDKVVGFCIFGGYEGVPDRFGPFGVDPDQQGKKLGKILLNLCLQQMKAESLHGAWFLWTGEKTTAGYLYKKTGFEVTRTFHVMKKDI
ncbi:GNAT family N-acetyltransferase [Ornithinibacillus halophilus]|uniref:Ribosomal protein S18 acetylase RimI n=1 Tax=Ornithinibacillus halophilus TaxID=930117 RepID=A0A1M5K238_9BACI|nr:GNAT family N-acetyltransferase [Ornithinibacillus halophilus]SHG46834.1 Ribosomal protein S18 acetylase RimI [Ornithinibacillus halophilus]